jgi:hypothetical protein
MHGVCRGCGELSTSQQSRPAFSLKLWTRLRLKWVTASRRAWKLVDIVFPLLYRCQGAHTGSFLVFHDVQIIRLCCSSWQRTPIHLQLHIQEVPDSNVGPETSCFVFFAFLLSPFRKMPGSASNYAMTGSSPQPLHFSLIIVPFSSL